MLYRTKQQVVDAVDKHLRHLLWRQGGPGIPKAGDTGQVLQKIASPNYQVGWGWMPDTMVWQVTEGGVWALFPASLTELLGSALRRTRLNLLRYREARLITRIGSVAGNAGSKLRAQYSANETDWSALNDSEGPQCSVSSANSTQVSSWVLLAPNAKNDVFLRVVGLDGNGLLSPVFGMISVQFR